MRNPPEERAASCSLCNMSISRERVDVMGFHFHRACAENVAKTLGQVKEYGEWREAHHAVGSPVPLE
jgi:hypothetical protein